MALPLQVEARSGLRAAGLWRWLPPLALLIGVLAFAYPVMLFESTEMWDHLWHVQYAQQWYVTGQPETLLPHIGYHLILMSVYPLLNNWQWTGIVVMLACYGVTALLIYGYLLGGLRDLSASRRWMIAFWSLALLVVAPISFLTWPTFNMYFGYIAPHPYHNPTAILVKPLALGQTIILLEALRRPRMNNLMLAGALLLALAHLMVKPNYALCLLPAVGLAALYRLYRRQPIEWAVLAVATAAPSLILLGYQYSLLDVTRGGVYFAPLESLTRSNPNSLDLWPLKLPLSMVFPLLVVLWNRRAARGSLALGVTWLAFAFGLAQFYLLNEAEHPHAGNFWWGAGTGLFVLFVISARFMLEQRPHLLGGASVRGWWAALSWSDRALIGVMVLHIVCGVWFWATHVQGLWTGIIAARQWW